MISIDEALSHVRQHAKRLAPLEVPLAEASGKVLAEDIISDIDSPPHDKSLVDGYAVIASDCRTDVTLDVLEEVLAGQCPTLEVTAGVATRIMTGAPLPVGATAVVMVEDSELLATTADGLTSRVRITCDGVATGQNVMTRGKSMWRDDTILHAGTYLRPIEVGLLAEVGLSKVPVFPIPTVAILPTGDELVPVFELPGPGQIRNSNEPMLSALCERCGARAMPLGIVGDNAKQMLQRVQQGCQADVLVLSGGVSAGIKDLVPGVLAQANVRTVFHRVRIKPGKPLWFGVYEDSDSDHRTLVFGLPGNPVSSLVCFELFVREALRRLSGNGAATTRVQAALQHEYCHTGGQRVTYYPAQLTRVPTENVRLLSWQGSADLRSLSSANCFAIFPAEDRQYQAGQMIDIFKF